MRFYGILIISILLIACNNQPDENAVLLKVPFKSLTDSIGLAPNNSDLYYRRAMLLSSQDQLELARLDMRKAYSLKVSEQNAFGLAHVLKKINIDSAARFLEQAVKDIPSSLSLRLGLARGYQAQGKNQEALLILEEIIDNNPGQVDAMRMLSDILSKTTEGDAAVSAAERAHNLVPTDPALAYDLVYAYAEAGNAKAIGLADSIIKAGFPELEKAYYSKGVYYVGKKQSTEALKNFDQAIVKNHNFLDAYYDKGLLLYDLGRYPQAMNTLQLAATVKATVPEIYYWMAMTDLKMGNRNEAITNFQRAYGLDKEMVEAKQKADSLIRLQ